MTDRGVNADQQHEIFMLVEQGYSLPESLAKSSLTDVQKRTLLRVLSSLGRFFSYLL